MYRQVSERSTDLSIVVDDPGQLRNTAAFLKKEYDINQLYNYRYNDYIDVVLSPHGDIELNNVFDILFFSLRYKDFSDTVFQEAHNRILITLFNGEETATAEYNIIDLFRTDTAHATENNLVPITSFNEFDDFNTPVTTETATSISSDTFGIKSDAFTQITIAESSFDDLISELDIYEQRQTTAYYIMSYNISRD